MLRAVKFTSVRVYPGNVRAKVSLWGKGWEDFYPGNKKGRETHNLRVDVRPRLGEKLIDSHAQEFGMIVDAVFFLGGLLSAKDGSKKGTLKHKSMFTVFILEIRLGIHASSFSTGVKEK